MLILASISGIQDFLFDVRESGGGQAKSLRHRSFRIQLTAECVALRLLEAAGVSRDEWNQRLLFCAAAKVAIDAHGLSDSAVQNVRAAAREMNRWLLNEAHGRLRLSVAIEPSNGRFAEVFERANRSLAEARLRPFRYPSVTGAPSWGNGALIAGEPYDADAEARRDVALGRRLVRARWLTIQHTSGRMPSDAVDVLGLSVELENQEPAPSDGLVSCSNLDRPEERPRGLDEHTFRVRRLARHIPRNDHGDPIEFVDLAAKSRGAAMLGILKADADSLGQAVSEALRTPDDGAAALSSLSNTLDRFFSERIEAQKMRDPWNLIYTVFSGGDDLLAVGPWHVMLDFAGHMRELFRQSFGPGVPESPSATPLTISAGVAIVKPMYPVHLAATQAEELLEQAKGQKAPHADEPKDQCAALGGVWKWSDHERIIGDGKKLADWVQPPQNQKPVVDRGWLHTLLELALLRRGQAGPEYAGVLPETATSRLTYHVARNWPQKRDKPRDDRQRAANAAREWIDAVLEDFDADPAQARGRVAHLPAILRYAMLATRGPDRGEQP